MPECTDLQGSSETLSVTLPGGVSVTAQYPSPRPITDLELALQMGGQLTAALGPIQAVLNLVEAVMALKAFAEAVPLLPTDPGAVLEAIEEVIEKTARVAQLLPQVSLPLTIAQLVDYLITLIIGMVDEVQKLVELEDRIANVQQILEETGNEALQGSIDCATSVLNAKREALSASLTRANGLIAIINALASSIGLPTVDNLEFGSGSLSEVSDALEDVEKVLRGVRALLPV